MLEEDADVNDAEDASEEWDNDENVFLVVLVVVLVIPPVVTEAAVLRVAPSVFWSSRCCRRRR